MAVAPYQPLLTERCGCGTYKVANRSATDWPLCKSHTRSVRSAEADTARPPLGVTATALSRSVWPSRIPTDWPLCKSHTRSVRSADPEMARSPSGVTATALTQSEWPSRVRTDLPLSKSHTRNVLSHEPETAQRPSGARTTARIQSVWPSNVRIIGPPGGARLAVKGRSQGQDLLSAAPFSKN